MGYYAAAAGVGTRVGEHDCSVPAVQ